MCRVRRSSSNCVCVLLVKPDQLVHQEQAWSRPTLLQARNRALPCRNHYFSTRHIAIGTSRPRCVEVVRESSRRDARLTPCSAGPKPALATRVPARAGRQRGGRRGIREALTPADAFGLVEGASRNESPQSLQNASRLSRLYMTFASQALTTTLELTVAPHSHHHSPPPPSPQRQQQCRPPPSPSPSP